MDTFFKDKTILITGATGSLGRELVRELLAYEPKALRIYSRDETKQFEMQKEFRRDDVLRFFLGDIRDEKRLHHAMEGVDYVFHAAALKHVVACEYNPFEALKTNVQGTENVIEAAMAAGVSRLVFTSTDKATNPCNTMGVSKLFAERLISSSTFYGGGQKTIMSTVRFGNVLGSRGSIVPLLHKQIAKGGPITLTDPNMTRFVMSIKDSLNLVFKGLMTARGGEVFVLKMPVVRIGDLVEVMIEELAPRFSYKPSDIPVEIIGAQPGEKLFEELATAEEMERVLDIDDMYVLLPQIRHLTGRSYEYSDAKKPDKNLYSSADEPPLKKPQIRELLEKAELL